jgi:hypothetical protein
VRRVVRRVELWSVLKVSIVFNTVMLGVALASVAFLWGLANTTGLLDDVEGFLRDSGFEDFRFEGDRMFRQVAYIGAVLTLAFTVFTVLAAALFNLISELTGGVRFVVIEEVIPRAERSAAATRPAPPAVPLPQPMPERVPADPVSGAPSSAPLPPGFGIPGPGPGAPGPPPFDEAVAPDAAPRGRVARRREPAGPTSGIPTSTSQPEGQAPASMG